MTCVFPPNALLSNTPRYSMDLITYIGCLISLNRWCQILFKIGYITINAEHHKRLHGLQVSCRQVHLF